jgi:hypothetical protein
VQPLWLQKPSPTRPLHMVAAHEGQHAGFAPARAPFAHCEARCRSAAVAPQLAAGPPQPPQPRQHHCPPAGGPLPRAPPTALQTPAALTHPAARAQRISVSTPASGTAGCMLPPTGNCSAHHQHARRRAASDSHVAAASMLWCAAVCQDTGKTTRWELRYMSRGDVLECVEFWQAAAAVLVCIAI